MLWSKTRRSCPWANGRPDASHYWWALQVTVLINSHEHHYSLSLALNKARDICYSYYWDIYLWKHRVLLLLIYCYVLFRDFFFFFSPSQTCTSLTCHSMVDEKCWYFVNIYLLYWKIIITFSHGDFGFSRSSDVATRQKYVNLVDSVKASGGSAHIFSSMHVSGERECNSAFIFSLGSYWRKLFLSWLT